MADGENHRGYRACILHYGNNKRRDSAKSCGPDYEKNRQSAYGERVKGRDKQPERQQAGLSGNSGSQKEIPSCTPGTEDGENSHNSSIHPEPKMEPSNDTLNASSILPSEEGQQSTSFRTETTEQNTPRRSTRQRHAPAHLRDFVTS